MTVHFIAEAATCSPEFIELGILGVGQNTVARSKVTVSPLNGKREIRIWSEITCGNSVATTEPIAIPIAALGHLTLTADDDGTEVTAHVRNDGSAPLSILVDFHADAELKSPDVDLICNTPGVYTTTAFAVGVDEVRSIRVAGGVVDLVAARSSARERASCVPERRAPRSGTMIDASLQVDAAEGGLRRGDRFALVGMVDVRGPQPAEEVAIAVAPIDGAAFDVQGIVIDGIRPIPADVREEAGRLSVRLGHLVGGRTTTVRIPLIATIDNPRLIDALRVEAEIHATGIEPQPLTVDVAVDRRPAFHPTSTFLGEIVEWHDRYAVTAELTNADGIRIERVRVRFEQRDVVPDKSVWVNRGGDDFEVFLRPSHLNEAAHLVAELGALEIGERVRVTLPFRPARGQDGFRTMAIRATVIADDDTIPLGTVERRISGRVDLGQSRIVRLDESPLRLGMPTEAKLEIRNDGDSPAHDVRLALTLPPSVGTSLPAPPEGERWSTLIPMLPAGGAVEMTVSFFLHAPPTDTSASVGVSIDAREQSELELATLYFATPSDPLLDPPRVRSLACDDGQIVFVARVINHGDGVAHDVRVRVEPHLDIVPRSTEVDGERCPDRGALPILGVGLELGHLDPGAYRDVTWYAAPASTEPYTCYVSVQLGDDHPRRTQTIPTRPRHRIGVSHALPSARRIDAESDPAALLAGARVGLPPSRSEARIAIDQREAIGSSLPPPQRDAVAALNAAPETHAPSSLPPLPDERLEHELDARLQAAAPPEVAPAADAVSVPVPPPTLEDPPEFPLPPAPAPDAENQSTAQTETAAEPTVEPAGAARVPEPDAAAAETTPAPDVTPEGSGDAFDDYFGDVDVAPETRVLASSYRDANVQQAHRMAQAIHDVQGLGWWRHVMIVRAMLPENVPLDGHALDAWNTLRAELAGPLKRAVPITQGAAFRANDAFVDALCANDKAAIDAVETILQDGRMPIFVGAAQGSTMLDVALPCMLPDKLGHDDLQAPWQTYKEALARIFSSAAIVRMSENERRDRYRNANATLDDALVALLAAFPS